MISQIVSRLQVGMHLKKKSLEDKVEVAKKSQEEDQVKVIYNIDIHQLSCYIIGIHIQSYC